jgi:protein-disulfide isomerase
VAAEQHLIEGTARSPVQVLIYEDLQCPDSAHFRGVLDRQLLPRYGGTVRFEHRDFPLPKHAWARMAAIAARFFEEEQPGLGLTYGKYALANLRTINLDNFNTVLSEFAAGHGVDRGKGEAALSDQRLAALVEKDYQDGVERGVAKTPTILVNGRPFIETFAFEDLAKAIDAELAASK